MGVRLNFSTVLNYWVVYNWVGRLSENTQRPRRKGRPLGIPGKGAAKSRTLLAAVIAPASSELGDNKKPIKRDAR